MNGSMEMSTFLLWNGERGRGTHDETGHTHGNIVGGEQGLDVGVLGDVGQITDVQAHGGCH